MRLKGPSFRTVRVSSDVHRELLKLKARWKMDSVDEVLRRLLGWK